MSRALDPNDIVPIPGHGQIALTPVIDDLIRTRYCIPSTILLVENLQISPLSRSGRWRAVMLLLGDGRLCIQALLGGGLHPFVETGQIAVGAYVRLDDFYIRVHELDGEGGGKPLRVVYLGVEDLVTVGWNKSFQEAWRRRAGEEVLGLQGRTKFNSHGTKTELPGRAAGETQQGPSQPQGEGVKKDESDDEDDAFEDVPTADIQHTILSRSQQAPSRAESSSARALLRPSSSTKPQIIAMPRDWHDHQAPLKLTTLQSIPMLPYAQNWTCNVLAIISSLSDVETSHLPPYKQRIARIADPSTSKRVHLTVFLSPDEFTPKVGSVVLLVGVKNHRFDGGSLKKYASDTLPVQWWFENPTHLGWCDIQGLRNWWDEVQRSQNS